MDPAIEIKNLSVNFRDRNGFVDALKNISLTVGKGEIFGFLGPNGAGKTTTIHVLLGFIRPAGGCAQIFGTDCRSRIARERIGYLPELPEMYGFLTGRELLRMAGRIFLMSGRVREQRIAQLLDLMELSHAADRRIAVYSRGMLQRLGFAQALINDPDLVILDEPTGGMDPLARMKMRELIVDIRRRGKTVFLSSHELSEVEAVCDHIAIIACGKMLAFGSTGLLLRGAASLEQYFISVISGGTASGGSFNE